MSNEIEAYFGDRAEIEWGNVHTSAIVIKLKKYIETKHSITSEELTTEDIAFLVSLCLTNGYSISISVPVDEDYMEIQLWIVH